MPAPMSDDERMRRFDALLAEQNDHRNMDATWVTQLTMAAAFLTLTIAVPAFLVSGFIANWSFRYSLSLVAATACATTAIASLLRRLGFPDQYEHVPAPVGRKMYAFFIVVFPLLVSSGVKRVYPDVTLPGIWALLVIGIAAMLGLALVTIQAALEYVIGGMVTLMVSNLFAVNPQEPDRALANLGILATGILLLLLFLVLKKAPGRMLGASLLAIPFGAGSGLEISKLVSFQSLPVCVILITLIAFRILFGIFPMVPQWRSFALFSSCLSFELIILFYDIFFRQCKLRYRNILPRSASLCRLGLAAQPSAGYEESGQDEEAGGGGRPRPR